MSIPGGRVNVGGNPEAVQGVVNGMDIDFPGDVFRDGSPVHKTEGIGRSGLGHAWQARRDRTASFAKNVFMGGFLSVFAAGQKPVSPEAARLFSFFSDVFGTPVCFLKGI